MIAITGICLKIKKDPACSFLFLFSLFEGQCTAVGCLFTNKCIRAHICLTPPWGKWILITQEHKRHQIIGLPSCLRQNNATDLECETRVMSPAFLRRLKKFEKVGLFFQYFPGLDKFGKIKWYANVLHHWAVKFFYGFTVAPRLS